MSRAMLLISISRRGKALVIGSITNSEQPTILPARYLRQTIALNTLHISGPALELCIRSGISVHLVTKSGRYLGQISNPVSDLRLRHHQHVIFHDRACCLAYAKTFVTAKLISMRRLLERWVRQGALPQTGRSSILFLSHQLSCIPQASTLASLRGMEGISSRVYFNALAERLLRLRQPEFAFAARSRRPPLDRVNSMLSFGYGLLLAEAESALRSTGLEVGLGCLHELTSNPRPNLALDFMEEFRPMIVDRLVVKLVTKRQIDAARDFPENSMLLNQSGIEIVSNAFCKRLERGLSIKGQRMTLRRSIRQQTKHLAKSIARSDPGYYKPVDYP